MCAATATGAASGLQRDVIFESYTPLSGSTELLRRLLSPLTAWRVQRALNRSHQMPREQAIDLAREKFVLYVPSTQPPQGYALLVFVPPWEEAKLPPQWINAFDRHGMIFVSAANSGNDANVLDRREPLAILAAQNVLQRYRVDPSRVYVGGFSGGSRVALRLALGYPDLFRGALLHAGSDPIGDTQIPLPPAPLFRQFQESTRLVYLTGKKDSEHLDQDVRSRHALQDWCVFDVTTRTMPWIGHEIADPAELDHALTALTRSAREPDKLDACRARIETQLAAQLHEVEDLIANNKTDKARAALSKLDAQYGGLAAPHSVELAEKIDPVDSGRRAGRD